MQPIIAHKGMNRFRCAVHGREAHSSYVTYGVNAIEYAARLIVYIRQIADRLAQFEQRDCGFTVPYTTLSTGLIRGGIAANVVPKECEFQFDLRTLPNASRRCPLSGNPSSRRTCSPARCAPRTLGGHRPRMGESDHRPRDRRERGDRAMGHEAEPRAQSTGKVSYGTEAGLFKQMGVPTVILGPGDIAEAHRPNEFVALEQLAQCETFMGRILEGGFPA